jgi:23S rRNA pseudouridine2605 synthase
VVNPNDASAAETIASETIRLNKFLALAGIASRRGSEELIRAGEIRVNGRRVVDPAFPIGELNVVEYLGRVVKPVRPSERLYLMLHKPVGVLSTLRPGKETGPALLNLVQIEQRVHPVGRLDKDSSGMLLMTNDGDLTLKLTHPRHEVEKEYLVKIHRPLHPNEIAKLRYGVEIDERPVEVRTLEPAPGGRLRIVIAEGRNRIVRRLFGALGCNVLELKRVRVGPLSLGHLGIGKWRKLTPIEVDQLRRSADYENQRIPRPAESDSMRRTGKGR